MVWLTTRSKTAVTYASQPWQKELINQTHAFLLAHLSWLGVPFVDPSTAFEAATKAARQVRVLDYACGPGTLTAILAGHATEFVGLDLSPNMVKAYNERFGSASDVNARATVGDLLSPNPLPDPSVSGPEYHDFDLAVVGFGFHHFADLPLATARLASRLKPGGVFMIADFVTHARIAHHAEHTIAHHGFGEHDVRSIFEGAGLVDFGYLEIPGEVEMVFAGGDGKAHYRTIFLAKGKKPASIGN